MAQAKRLPKADYFRQRYSNAVEQGLTSKAAYYKDRLIQMGEFAKVEVTKLGKLERTELSSLDGKGGSIVFYSM
jgi:hypothetical protein